jgi:hypothetical protein
MAKKTTVVFYPHTARIYVGDYEHKGEELFIVNPASTPQGIPLEYWKLVDNSIVEMSQEEKDVVDNRLLHEQHAVIDINGVQKAVQTQVVGITEQGVDIKLSKILEDFHKHLDVSNKKMEENNNSIEDQISAVGSELNKVLAYSDLQKKRIDKLEKYNLIVLCLLIGLSILEFIVRH